MKDQKFRNLIFHNKAPSEDSNEYRDVNFKI